MGSRAGQEVPGQEGVGFPGRLCPQEVTTPFKGSVSASEKDGAGREDFSGASGFSDGQRLGLQDLTGSLQ